MLNKLTSKWEWIIVGLIAGALALATIWFVFFADTTVAEATGQETCPNSAPWVKVDDLDGHSYTYTPPEGYTVTDNCYKHSTYVHFGSGDTVETDSHWECNPWWNCKWKKYELSHASFKLEKVETEPEVCEDDSALNYGKELPCEYPPVDPCIELLDGSEFAIRGDEVVACPTPTPEPPVTTNAGRTVEAPVCPDGSTTQLVANLHVWRNGGSADVNFFLTEGNHANIYWKVNDAGDWQHAVSGITPNSDNFISYTINDLDPNLGYTFGVQQTVGCGGGEIATSVVVDPPANGKLFNFSYWSW